MHEDSMINSCMNLWPVGEDVSALIGRECEKSLSPVWAVVSCDLLLFLPLLPLLSPLACSKIAEREAE